MKRKSLMKFGAIALTFLFGTTLCASKNTISNVKADSNPVHFGIGKIVDIEAGEGHTLALDEFGNVWGWGRNHEGQLGTDVGAFTDTPVNLFPGHKFVKISAGSSISGALDSNGKLYLLGKTRLVDLDNVSNNMFRDEYVSGNVVKNGPYSSFQCALSLTAVNLSSRNNQREYFGYSYVGHPSNYSNYWGGFPYVSAKKNIDIIGTTTENFIKSIDGNFFINSANYKDSYRVVAYVEEDGNLSISSRFYKDPIEYDLSSISNLSFVDCAISNIVVSIDNISSSTIYTVTNDGKVFSFGYNGQFNMLGSSSTNGIASSSSPVQVDGLENIVDITAGENHVIALDKDGRLFSWGDNTFGQLGVSHTEREASPVSVDSFNSLGQFSFTSFIGETYEGSLSLTNASNFTIITDAEQGNFNLNTDGSFAYTPENTAKGTDFVTVSCDIGAETKVFSINITLDNKPYVLNGSNSIVVNRNQPYSDFITGYDPDKDSLSYSIVGQPSKGTVEIASTGKFTYTPLLDAAGGDQFVVAISDGKYTLNYPIVVHIESEIVSFDDKNILIDNTTNASYSGNVQAFDADGDELTYSVSGQPSKGILTLSDDGSYIYNANEGASGSDTFSIKVDDGNKPLFLTYSVSLYDIKDNGTQTAFAIPVGTSLENQIKTLSHNVNVTYSLNAIPNKGTVEINETDGTYKYIPNPGTRGEDTFTVGVNYGYGSYEKTITVYQNTAPNTDLLELNVVTKENTNYTGSINTTDLDGDTLTYSVVTNPTLGNVSINSTTGEYTYYPNVNVAGKDTMTFAISDGINTSIVKVNIKVESETVISPVSTQILSQNTSLFGSLNVQNKDGDDLVYSIKTEPSNGVASVDTLTGDYTYIPNNGYYGNDSFVIEVDDGTLPKEVTINVFVNRKPVANAISIDLVAFGNSVSGVAACSDPDGDALTYNVVNEPSKGSVVLNHNNGTFAYTPNEGAAGNDFFTISVSDGFEETVVTVNVHNETEVTLDSQETNIVANQGQSTSGQVLATDLDEDELTFSVETNPSKGTLSLNAFTGAWTYIAKQTSTGTDAFSITVSDEYSSKTIEYSVKINSPAKFQNVETNVTTNQNTNYVGTVSAVDSNGDALEYLVINNGQKGDVTIDALTGKYIYVPKADAAGDDIFTLGVSDGAFTTEVEITMHIETPITVLDETISCEVDKDNIVSGKIDAEDLDGDVLTYKISTAATKGTANVTADGSWSYFASGDVGNDSFIISVSDGIHTVYVTVYAHVNGNPYFEESATTLVVGIGQTKAGRVSAVDEDGDVISYSLKKAPNYGTVTVNSFTGEYKYTASSNKNISTDSFVISATDGKTTVDSTVSVKINNKPTASSSYTIQVNQGQKCSGYIEAYDSEHDELTYSILSQGSKGKAIINSSTGEYEYTLNDKKYTGNDTFIVQISDGYNVTDVTVNVQIITNAAPVSYNSSVDVPQGGTISGTIVSTDAEGDTLAYSIINNAKKGTVTINPLTGEYTYMATDKSFNGTDFFTVEISDGINAIQVTVTVNVNENLKPIGTGSTLTVDSGDAGFGKITASDSDGDGLIYSISSQGTKGTASINSETGEFTYTSKTGESGYDCFVVSVSDGYHIISFLVDVSINASTLNLGLGIGLGVGIAAICAAGTALALVVSKKKGKAK